MRNLRRSPQRCAGVLGPAQRRVGIASSSQKTPWTDTPPGDERFPALGRNPSVQSRAPTGVEHHLVRGALSRASELQQQTSGERQVGLKTTAHIHVVVWQPRVEVPHFEPKADAYFSDADNRASVNPATKHKGPGICT